MFVTAIVATGPTTLPALMPAVWGALVSLSDAGSATSPKPDAKSSRTRSTSAAASSPKPSMEISSPPTVPSPAMDSGLSVSALRPVAVEILMQEPRSLTSLASAAAGRACRPIGFISFTLARASASSAFSAGFCSAGSSANCSILPLSAERAAETTSSRLLPPEAATAAASRPSTNGAATTRTSTSKTNSHAISAESTAEPRSEIITTPSPESAAPMDSATAMASVPNSPEAVPAAN